MSTNVLMNWYLIWIKSIVMKLSVKWCLKNGRVIWN